MLSMLGEGEWGFGSSLQFPKDSYLYTTTDAPPNCPMQFMATGASLYSQLLYDHTLLLKRLL